MEPSSYGKSVNKRIDYIIIVQYMMGDVAGLENDFLMHTAGTVTSV